MTILSSVFTSMISEKFFHVKPLPVSWPQDTGHKCRVSSDSKRFIFNTARQVEDLPAEQKNRLKNSWALSSVNTSGTSAAMNVIKQISPTQEENRKAINDYKIKSRSPYWGGFKQKTLSHKTEALWNLTLPGHTFNGGEKTFQKTKTQNRSARGGTMEH